MKPGDRVRVPFGARTDVGIIEYVGPAAVCVLIEFPTAMNPLDGYIGPMRSRFLTDEPVRRR